MRRKTSRSPGIGRRFLTTLNSWAHTENLLWYFILFLSIYAKRTYGAPVLNQAFMLPLAAYPTAWISTQLTAQNLGSHSWNHTAVVSSPHSDAPTIHTSTSSTPNSTEASVETSTYILMLIAAGSLGAMITGITALLRRLLHRDPSPPNHPGHEHQEEEEDEEKIRIRKILQKAPHLRSPMERIAADRWSRQQDPFQL